MRRELEIMSRLSHPNVVRVLGGNIKPPTMLIVEELMVGWFGLVSVVDTS